MKIIITVWHKVISNYLLTRIVSDIINMRYIVVVITILILGVSDLSYTQNALPNWIQNPESKYPSELYMASIGEGMTREEAEKSAIANLSLIFKADIKANTRTIQLYNEIISDNKNDINESSDISKNIKINTSGTIYNVQIGDSYYGNNKYYVLSFLDRESTAKIYINKIMANNKEIVSFINSADTIKNKLQYYSLLKSADIISSINRSLISQLNIIRPYKKNDIEFGYNPNEIENRVHNAAMDISFSVNIQNSEDLKNIIEGIITKFGFVLGTNKPDLEILGIIKYIDVPLQRKEAFIKWSFDLKILDDMGAVIQAYTFNGREGASNYELAKNRSVYAIQKIIKIKLPEYITDYFANNINQ